MRRKNSSYETSEKEELELELRVGFKRPQWLPLPRPQWPPHSALFIDSVKNAELYNKETVEFLAKLAKPNTNIYEYLIDRLYFIGKRYPGILTLRSLHESILSKEWPVDPLFDDDTQSLQKG